MWTSTRRLLSRLSKTIPMMHSMAAASLAAATPSIRRLVRWWAQARSTYITGRAIPPEASVALSRIRAMVSRYHLICLDVWVFSQELPEDDRGLVADTIRALTDECVLGAAVDVHVIAADINAVFVLPKQRGGDTDDCSRTDDTDSHIAADLDCLFSQSNLAEW